MFKLELSRVSKVFQRNVKVIDNMSFEVRAGELIAVVGPSGCGKSTLLKITAGLDQATDGSVCLGGEDITMKSPGERNIAMVFQNYALYPHLTVRENLAYPLRLQRPRRKDINVRVRKAAEQLQLLEFLDRHPADLSGGQRQRVAMGRAIVREPRLFLLDEPLSNLDPNLRVHVRDEIKGLQRRLGTTMLYVTHDQIEASTLGERVMILRNGQIEQFAAPSEIYEEPATAFSAAFFSSPPPNFCYASVLDGSVLCFGMSVPIRKFALIEQVTYIPKSVILAIRPEHLVPAREGLIAEDLLRLSGKVFRCERHGRDVFVRFGLSSVSEVPENASATLVHHTGVTQSAEFVWLTNCTEDISEHITVSVPLSRVLVFCASSGKRL